MSANSSIGVIDTETYKAVDGINKIYTLGYMIISHIDDLTKH